MIAKKTDEEIKIMREGGRILAHIINAIGEEMKPGVTGKHIDGVAKKNILKAGGKPAFKGYRGYPATVCFSIDDVVVHGIPGDNPVEEGQIVGVDLGILYKGFYTDAAKTFEIGKVSEDASRLLNVTKTALESGMNACVPGNKIGDISSAVQEVVESNGYSVVRELVGHGIGRKMHEPPEIPNYGTNDTGPDIEVGMTMALEPMVNQGNFAVEIDDDQWTVRTVDGKLSAHFEHTIAVTNEGPVVLTKL